MNRIVEVVPYNHEWPQQFAAEAVKIQQALGANCIAVHHIGSTAVPGLAAKPIIDIIPVVKDIRSVNIKALEAIGYIDRGECGMPFRRYLYTGQPQHTYHLHIWQQDNPEIEKHLLFKSYLIAHPTVMKQYAELKNNLAQQFKDDHHKYTASKNYFIIDVRAKTGFKGLTIVEALHEEEWQEYHRIKKTQIFDRLPHIVYDPAHPTLTEPNQHHFVLLQGTEIIAISQVEMFSEQAAVLRTLATDEQYQGHGYGAYLLALMERWIVQFGKTKMLMHAARRAENFYRKRGYVNMDFDDTPVSDDSINLGKIL